MSSESPTPVAPPRRHAPNWDDLEGRSYVPKPGDTPAGHIPLSRHYEIVHGLIDRHNQQFAELSAELATVKAELAKVKRAQSPIGILLSDDEIRNAIASSITWLGRAVSVSFVVVALAWAGYEIVYGDVSIGRSDRDAQVNEARALSEQEDTGKPAPVLPAPSSTMPGVDR